MGKWGDRQWSWMWLKEVFPNVFRSPHQKLWDDDNLLLEKIFYHKIPLFFDHNLVNLTHEQQQEFFLSNFSFFPALKEVSW